jgi:hypothetical protein
VAELKRSAEEKMSRILLSILTMFIAGCSSGGFTDHLAFQNRIAVGARKPPEATSLIVREDLALQFRRGAITSVFSATMAEGRYVGILETNEGAFFLAPWGSFLYEMNDQPESVIGGIFVRREDQKPFVWFIPKQGSEAEWKAWLVGDRIEKVKPGITNVAFRPWVESDFQVPADRVGPQERGPIQPAQTTSGS